MNHLGFSKEPMEEFPVIFFGDTDISRRPSTGGRSRVGNSPLLKSRRVIIPNDQTAICLRLIMQYSHVTGVASVLLSCEPSGSLILIFSANSWMARPDRLRPQNFSAVGVYISTLPVAAKISSPMSSMPPGMCK